MHWRKTFGIAIAVLALIAAIAYGFKPVPQRVDVVETQRGPLRVTIEEEGKTRVIDRYVVSAPVAAYARRLQLNVGDAIERGHALLTLEPLPSAVLDPRSRAAATARVEGAQAAFEAAKKQVLAAQAEAELAQLEYERVRELCKVQCASQREEDLALTRLRSTRAYAQSAEFNVDIARHEVEAAKTALSYAGTSDNTDQLTVTSPINGRVLKILHESEAVVSAGQALVEVGHPQQLEVEVDVLSADAVKITPGTRVLFERWGGEQPLEGRVTTVEPVGFTKISALGVEEQRVLVISELTSPPERWQRLGDGYRVEASFILWEDEDVLIVPASSLFRHGEGWAVFVVADGTARRVPVEVGHRNGLQAQVLSGLADGQQVITHPSTAVDDGVKIEIR